MRSAWWAAASAERGWWIVAASVVTGSTGEPSSGRSTRFALMLHARRMNHAWLVSIAASSAVTLRPGSRGERVG